MKHFQPKLDTRFYPAKVLASAGLVVILWPELLHRSSELKKYGMRYFEAIFGSRRDKAKPDREFLYLLGEAKKINGASKVIYNVRNVIDPPCDVCKHHVKTKLCKQCKLARYCSTACQKRDWKDGHKSQCAKK